MAFGEAGDIPTWGALPARLLNDPSAYSISAMAGPYWLFVSLFRKENCGWPGLSGCVKTFALTEDPIKRNDMWICMA
jgi:hypothetical protein